jgi:hypothetical protein
MAERLKLAESSVEATAGEKKALEEKLARAEYLAQEAEKEKERRTIYARLQSLGIWAPPWMKSPEVEGKGEGKGEGRKKTASKHGKPRRKDKDKRRGSKKKAPTTITVSAGAAAASASTAAAMRASAQLSPSPSPHGWLFDATEVEPEVPEVGGGGSDGDGAGGGSDGSDGGGSGGGGDGGNGGDRSPDDGRRHYDFGACNNSSTYKSDVQAVVSDEGVFLNTLAGLFQVERIAGGLGRILATQQTEGRAGAKAAGENKRDGGRRHRVRKDSYEPTSEDYESLKMLNTKNLLAVIATVKVAEFAWHMVADPLPMPDPYEEW